MNNALGRYGCLGLIVGTIISIVLTVCLAVYSNMSLFVIEVIMCSVLCLSFIIGYILDDNKKGSQTVKPLNQKETERKLYQNNILFPLKKKPTNISNTTSQQVSNLQKIETDAKINHPTKSIKCTKNPVRNTMKHIEMKDIKTLKQLGNYIFTLLNVERDVALECDKDCFYTKNREYDCPHKAYYKKAGIKISNSQIECIKVVLNVKYISTDSDSFFDSNISLIDSNGFVYEGCEICEECLKFGFVTGRYNFHAPSQINYIILFPNLSPEIEFSKIRITIDDDILDFLFTDEPNAVEQLANDKSGKLGSSKQNEEDNFNHDFMDTIKLNEFKEAIYRIKFDIHKRLHNDLDLNGKKKIEERIENQSYMLNIRIEGNGWESNPIYAGIIRDYRDSMEQYEMHRMAIEEFDKQEEMKIQKVSELLNMNPYMFEQLCAQILSRQGFENIVVTPRSNDRGVDIICNKGGLKYAVQCKRHVNAVGSPDMQKFIGALQNERADMGLFITTSTFTKEAKIMASNNAIDLVDKYKLAEWLAISEDILKNEDLFN